MLIRYLYFVFMFAHTLYSPLVNDLLLFSDPRFPFFNLLHGFFFALSLSLPFLLSLLPNSNNLLNLPLLHYLLDLRLVFLMLKSFDPVLNHLKLMLCLFLFLQ